MKRAIVISSIALAACGKLLGLSEDVPAPNVGTDASANPNDASSADEPDGAPIAEDSGPNKERIVFVTNEATQGNFGGLAGGDARCNAGASKGRRTSKVGRSLRG